LESEFRENEFQENELFFDIWYCNEKQVGKHFPMFGYVMENKLENNLLMFYFFKFIKIIRNKSYKLKS
jgi:hypothetical protein